MVVIIGLLWLLQLDLLKPSRIGLPLSENHVLSSIDVESYSCSHDYSIEIMSLDPVVLYLDRFLKESEIQHLLAVT